MLNQIRNFIHQHRRNQLRKQIDASPQWSKNFLEQGLDGLVRLIEPGSKRNFLEQNHASYYELEHRYGTHIWIYARYQRHRREIGCPETRDQRR